MERRGDKEGKRAPPVDKNDGVFGCKPVHDCLGYRERGKGEVKRCNSV